MRILGIKEGHDGGVCLIEDGTLVYSLEAEKDSFPRAASLSGELLWRAANLSPSPPDVIAIGGWTKGRYSSELRSLSGYFGISTDGMATQSGTFFGHPVRLFSSSHERSHIWCAYGMSPLPQGQPCYVLEWEGNIGNFYYVDEKLNIKDLGSVLEDPGNKYTFLFSLADQASPSQLGFWDTSHPGKLMALAAYGEPGPMSPDELAVTDFILSRKPIMTTTRKDDLSWSPYHNIGVTSQAFKDLAAKFSDRIYDLFWQFAERHLKPGLPLLITGGCGLNCEWNSKWRDSGMFSEVYVPPCCSDSGSAIGTAVDALRHFTGQAKLNWSIYAGESFVWDSDPDRARFTPTESDPESLARRIAGGAVAAWVEGRYEIGPRALGHRSLLAEPFDVRSRVRLNQIKRREDYRPIAPICLETDVGNDFEPASPSPHMLYFYRVRNRRLAAITHVDGSARIQTVGPNEPMKLASVLREFKEIAGTSTMCNTSLNFSGRGFINRMSDLADYCYNEGVDIMVVDGKAFANTKAQMVGE